MTTGTVSRSTRTVGTIRRLEQRLAGLLAAAPDPGPVVPHNGDWTVRDLVAHLVTVTSRYAPGDAPKEFARSADEVADINDAELDALHGETIPVLLQRLHDAVEALPCGREVDEGAPVPYTGGTSVTPPDLLGILLGEYVVHGLDLARALGARWDVTADDAAEVLRSLSPILPAWVDPDGARGLTATFEIRLRGHDTARWIFTDGVLAIVPGGGRRDVTISADPAALLLVSYRRVPLWKPILGGRMVAWGPRAMLAFRTNSYFRAP